MSEWAMLTLGAWTALVLGLGLGLTFLEFQRADKKARGEDSRGAAGARVGTRGRAA